MLEERNKGPPSFSSLFEGWKMIKDRGVSIEVPHHGEIKIKESN